MNTQHTQGTLDWHRARHGKITGSVVGELIKSPKARSTEPTKTALNYLRKVASERTTNPLAIKDDGLYEEYLRHTNVRTKDMDWGHEQEPYAREQYSKIKGYEVHEIGSVKHPRIQNFASSPDGYVVTDTERGCIEIKSLKPERFTEYVLEVTDGETLKEVNKTYYWQCVSHMAVTGASWCDLVVYAPFQDYPIYIVRIRRDEEEIKILEESVRQAEEQVKEMVNKIKQRCQSNYN